MPRCTSGCSRFAIPRADRPRFSSPIWRRQANSLAACPRRAYFALIRSLTDLVDAAVVADGGLSGKHTGDGASALFGVDGAEGESTPARGAIDAARRIRNGAAGLLDDTTEVLAMSVFTGGRR
jgi:hypothetical protein